MNEATKTCRKCRRDLPASAFHKCRRNKDGLQNWCIECHAPVNAAWGDREKRKRQEQREKREAARLEVQAARLAAIGYAETTKQCSRCLKVLPVSEFHSGGQHVYLASQCKACKRLRFNIELTRAMLKPCEPFCPLLLKRCEKCKEVSPVDNFRVRSAVRKAGRRNIKLSTCRDCEREARKQYWKNMPQEKKGRRYKYRREYARTDEGNKAVKESQRKSYQKARKRILESVQDYNYRRGYGITLEDYNRMVAERGGLCDICKRSPRGRRLCVDHDHVTGKVRGLLCNNCNLGISYFRDDVSLFGRAADYLTLHQQAADENQQAA